MRMTLHWVRMVLLVALSLAACAGSCGRQPLLHDPGATKTLDYAPFMKGSADAIAAAFAGYLGVTLLGLAADAGADHDDYAVAGDGLIRMRFDHSHRPLSVNYRAPAGCPSPRTPGAKAMLPAEANASVLSLLRRMAIPVDDTAAVESQLHQEGRSWIGVYVRQTYRGEPIDRPSAFAVVDAITGQICELRLPRWYAGLETLGPPLPAEVLVARARNDLSGEPTLGGLEIVADNLCRKARLDASPTMALCLDVVTGNPTRDP